MKRWQKIVLGFFLALVMLLVPTSCSTVSSISWGIPNGCTDNCKAIKLAVYGNYDSVTIDWGDGSPIETLHEAMHTYAESGKYTITIAAKNGNETVVQKYTVTLPYDGSEIWSTIPIENAQ